MNNVKKKKAYRKSSKPFLKFLFEILGKKWLISFKEESKIPPPYFTYKIF